MNYVIGFAFNRDRVALIRKAKPVWQAGRLNGIGGKIEPGETQCVAMAREFREETGVDSSATEWGLKFIMQGGGWEAHVYAMEMDDERFESLRTTTIEAVEKHYIANLSFENCISNLYWMVPLARDKSGVKLPITIPFVHDDGTGS
jgi:8-oxo-dGTP diphosphatase